MNRVLFAALVAAQMVAYAQTPFGPVESWKAAVQSGDEAAIRKFYGERTERLRAGRNPTDLNSETAFWAGLRSRGLTQFNPRILEIVPMNGNNELRLRISAELNGKPLVISADQIWAHTPTGWKIAAEARSGDFEIEATRRLPQPVVPNVKLYPEPREAEADLKSALAKARSEHKRVIVVFGGNWCYDCHVLDTTFHSKEFAPLVDANYVVVHINIGDEGKDNAALAARLGVALDKGVPSLGVLEPGGKVIYAQKNGEFESTVKIGPEDVRAFLEKWKPARRA